MKYSEDLVPAVNYSVDRYKWRVKDNKFHGAGNTSHFPFPADSFSQIPYLTMNLSYLTLCRRRVIFGDICIDLLEIQQGIREPFDIQETIPFFLVRLSPFSLLKRFITSLCEVKTVSGSSALATAFSTCCLNHAS